VPAEWLLGLLLGVLYVAAIVAMRQKGAFTDEVDHYAQISLFVRADWRVLPGITTIPGYHLLVGVILHVTGNSLDAARLVNAGFGLIAIAGFHALRRQLWSGTETLATAQFIALPILVPLFFVVYTDVLALALLLWAAWANVVRRHALAALLLTLLVGVRQHEVVWSGLFGLFAITAAPTRTGLRDGWRALRSLLPYALPLVCFGLFWWWNGTVSLSRSEAGLHPDLSLHAGNPCLALLVAGLLLPLHVLSGMREFSAAVRRCPALGAIPFLLAAGFWFGFRPDNPYNTALPSYYLHNLIPALIDGDQKVRALAAVAAAVAACGLAPTRLRPPGSRWFYPFALLFLAASWLVELRYVLVPFVLWLALREHRGRAIEHATLALWLVLAVCMMFATVTHRFFL
jgi:alpha-1,2-glucosyltransferase